MQTDKKQIRLHEGWQEIARMNTLLIGFCIVMAHALRFQTHKSSKLTVKQSKEFFRSKTEISLPNQTFEITKLYLHHGVFLVKTKWTQSP